MKEITVAIPCYNEEITIGRVISDFKKELPEAKIIVFNNNSSDRTVEIAKQNGAIIIHERKQGKGHVIKKMFQVIDSDILVLVDGDGTYFAEDVHKLINLVINNDADMAVGNRLHKRKQGISYSHRLANALFLFLLNYFFRSRFKDILSGYRVMKKDFYQGIPLLGNGFEIETELTLQSLDRNFSIMEAPVRYAERPKGSYSKIKFSDSYKIILTIISLLRDYRPMIFFGYLGSFFIILGFFFGSIVVDEYYRTGFIGRVPTAILSITLIIIGINAIISGLILSAVGRRQKETEAIIKKLYLNK